MQLLQIHLQQPADRRFRFLLQPRLIEQLVVLERRTGVQRHKRHLVPVAEEA